MLHSFLLKGKGERRKGGVEGRKKKRQRSRHSPATCHIPRQESSQRKEPFLQEATAAQESLLNPLRWREPARLTRGFQSTKETRPCPLSPKKERERWLEKAELIKEQVLPPAEPTWTLVETIPKVGGREIMGKEKHRQNARMNTTTVNADGWVQLMHF